MGQSAPVFIPLLNQFLLDLSAPLEVRLAAAGAFRRFSCSADVSAPRGSGAGPGPDRRGSGADPGSDRRGGLGLGLLLVLVLVLFLSGGVLVLVLVLVLTVVSPPPRGLCCCSSTPRPRRTRRSGLRRTSS